jgi:CubicO group peptidase (beta-lactamase class C family)
MSDAKPGGLNKDRLLHLRAVVEEDIRRGLYLGGVLVVARHGEVGLYEALGHADEAHARAVKKDSVFSIFSVTKAFTNVLVFRAIEQGRLALTTPISSVIPEFSGRGREKITLFHLLTHTSGIPSLYTPREGMCIDRLSEIIQAICDNPNVYPVEAPGARVDYSPMVNHALLGEAVRRTDPRERRYRQIVEDEILKPLRMADTSVGLRRDLKERHLAPEFRGNAPMNHLGHSNLGSQGAFLEEEAEMPWVGVSSTAGDMFRFAEALRRGGELDGARILGPTILERARECWTGDKPNEVYKRLAESRGWRVMPAYIGLGFSLRGVEIGQTLFGTLTSPHTFGNYGAGSTLFWVDPALDMTFVGLTTGVMSSGDNIERWQRLSDIALSAAM